MSAHTPGRTVEGIGKRLTELRKLARLESKEFGAVSERTLRLINEEISAIEAVFAIDDIAKATGEQA